MIPSKMPPLGVRPRKFVDEARAKELYDAILRYRAANLSYPTEWFTEYNEIRKRLLKSGDMIY